MGLLDTVKSWFKNKEKEPTTDELTLNHVYHVAKDAADRVNDLWKKIEFCHDNVRALRKMQDRLDKQQTEATEEWGTIKLNQVTTQEFRSTVEILKQKVRLLEKENRSHIHDLRILKDRVLGPSTSSLRTSKTATKKTVAKKSVVKKSAVKKKRVKKR